MDPLAQAIARSPELLPLTLNPDTDQAALVRLSEADYARASFLDERVLGNGEVPRRPVSWQHLEQGAAELAADSASYIFHIGNVGSTLLSRLLGQHPAVFSLREPAILRTFAQISADAAFSRWNANEFEQRLDTVLKLLSRTFQPNQRALIKATSFVSELAGRILERPSAPKAIFMFVPAETYLVSILGAPNSPAEAKALAPSRLGRLHRRIGAGRWRLSDLSLGEIVAMSWACEMSTLTAAARVATDRVLWLNFEHLLDGPAASLPRVFNHLAIEVSSKQIDALLAGPEMRRYSKAPEHPYDANLRRIVLEQGRGERATEISRGLAWLKEAAAEFSDIPKQVDNA
jgi:hypothetical protein